MRLIITGGSGFIMTNMFQYLLTLPDEEQPEIRLIDRQYGQDLTQWEDVDRAWKNFEPDAVINAASYTHIDDSIKNPRKFWGNNIELMLNVLEACRKYDCRLLQISSSEVYGTQVYVPQDEEHPLQPHSPYALTKVVQDRSCYAWWQTYELDVSIVRPFNQFGPYQQTQKLIPKFAYNIIHGLPLPIYGEGNARRDWLYVKDTCRGLWMALNKLPAGEVVNLSTGKSWSITEVANLLKNIVPKVSGKMDLSKIVTVDHVDDRWGHVFHLEGSYEKAEKLLEWKPEYTFPEALEETVSWYVQNNFAVPYRRGG
ncbi:MAG TPA: GDP-mannose 4,6-dehydratase [Dehalococcoidia bacterium]|nr:GDP-mannose 4,6-dehydratase [Dehalococcoidia bacterium]